MAKVSTNLQFAILFFLYSCASIPVSYGRNHTRKSLNIRAVNLGGWLVTEGWITPALYDGIPNKDFLDGTQLQLKSVTHGKYLSAKSGGVTKIFLNGTSASESETFTLWRLSETTFNFRLFNQQFMGMNTNGVIVANDNAPGLSQEFEIERHVDDPTLVRIKASNGRYIQVKNEELITADSVGGVAGWGDDDPSVFKLNITATLQGDYQLSNGYGPEKAPQVMREHWNTYIVEKDFKFMADNGINAVRIPVGWWITSDPSPPKPFVSGSLEVLDKAFMWARKYGLKVLLDLHSVPGSQNPWEHSATRDGTVEWLKSNATIQQSVAIVEFLTKRYANHPSLYAVEILNEPLTMDRTALDLVKGFYKAAYDGIRKHSKTVYVMLCVRLGAPESAELTAFASGLERSVLDLHYYNLFTTVSGDMTVDQNIRYIKEVRSAQIRSVKKSLTFVGEWSAEWKLTSASPADYKRYAEVQLEVFGGQTTFGWAYWTFRHVKPHWSFEWMVKNGYIKLT